jgi:hypothetical protein
MKKFISFLFLFSVFIANAEDCGCGSHAEGLYDYSVKDGTGGCCKGIGSGPALYTTWTQGPGRTWINTGVKEVTVAAAQSACCPGS